MADTTISQLPPAALPLAGNETLPLDQSGATKRATVADIKANIPQRLVAIATDTLLDSDNGGHIYFKSAGIFATVTIPANVDMPMPIGAAITLVNDPASGDLTVDSTFVTLLQMGTFNVGNRTLQAQGQATLLKIDTDTWTIVGAGLT
jgi:hypothetical protein